MKNLQSRLRAEIAKLGRGGMSALARYAGVTPQTVRSWVADGAEPNEESLLKAAAFLRVTPQWLRYGTDEVPAPPPPKIVAPVLEYLIEDEQILIQNYRRSTDEGKQQIQLASRVSDKRPIEEVLRPARAASND